MWKTMEWTPLRFEVISRRMIVVEILKGSFKSKVVVAHTPTLSAL